MINLRQWLVSMVTSDTTLQTLLRNNTASKAVTYSVFPIGTDIQPEAFPALTFMDAGITLLSVPKGMHVGNFQVDIFSIKNELEIETIYERLVQLINYQHSRITTSLFPNGTLYWIRETVVKDTISTGTSRRLWRKTINYKVWFTRSDLQ